MSFQVAVCPACGSQLMYVQQYGQWYCQSCAQYRQPAQPNPMVQPAPQVGPSGMQMGAPDARWYQNSYHIRKKVLAVAHQYWIEDQAGSVLGYSKQKLLKLKDDIRIYADENMAAELFRIQQQQIVDAWGNFAVIDSTANTLLGYVKRRALASAMVRDEWEVRDAAGQLIGELHESTGRGLARKYMPGGKLIPEKVTLELGGRPVVQINQRFKVIGDIWDIEVQAVPPSFDRRVIVSCALLMGMIERERK